VVLERPNLPENDTNADDERERAARAQDMAAEVALSFSLFYFYLFLILSLFISPSLSQLLHPSTPASLFFLLFYLNFCFTIFFPSIFPTFSFPSSLTLPEIRCLAILIYTEFSWLFCRLESLICA
jgi:hypothetical protein